MDRITPRLIERMSIVTLSRNRAAPMKAGTTPGPEKGLAFLSAMVGIPSELTMIAAENTISNTDVIRSAFVMVLSVIMRSSDMYAWKFGCLPAE
jgi:hypothetical protein